MFLIIVRVKRVFLYLSVTSTSLLRSSESIVYPLV